MGFVQTWVRQLRDRSVGDSGIVFMPTMTKYDDPKTVSAADEPVFRVRRKRPGLVGVYSEKGVLVRATAIRRACSIGRRNDCDIAVDEPRVSRLHATVQVSGGGLTLTDERSHNGTHVDGIRVTGTVPLAAGSVIRIGGALLVVVEDVDEWSEEEVGTHPIWLGAARTARLRAKLEELAPGRLPVLIQGETGTGKELAARLIHTSSGRSGQLVAVNCAALPADLVESELFGHVRGAFSGSQTSRPGLFRSAHRGTLLLDEIGDLPISAQAKLLRVLEESSVRPVGQDEQVPVDVRLLSATNRPLEMMVDQGRFRQDLFHRIGTTNVLIPPLRERSEDIPAIALGYLRESGLTISIAAMERLMLAPWPGNVRQLANTIRAAALEATRAGKETIRSSDLAIDIPTTNRAPNAEADADRVRICTALELREGNVAQVARDLDMRRGGLYEAFERLGIDPAAYRRK